MDSVWWVNFHYYSPSLKPLNCSTDNTIKRACMKQGRCRPKKNRPTNTSATGKVDVWSIDLVVGSRKFHVEKDRPPAFILLSDALPDDRNRACTCALNV